MRFLVYLTIVALLTVWGISSLLDQVDAIQNNARLQRQQREEILQ